MSRDGLIHLAIVMTLTMSLSAGCGSPATPIPPTPKTVPPTVTLTPVPTPMPTLVPPPTPTLVPTSMIWRTVTVKPGGINCLDFLDFELTFSKHLIEETKKYVLWYSEDPYSPLDRYTGWIAGMEMRDDLADFCTKMRQCNGCRQIWVSDDTPPGTYDVRYAVTIYREEGMRPKKETRQYLTEGTTYLRLFVATPTP